MTAFTLPHRRRIAVPVAVPAGVGYWLAALLLLFAIAQQCVLGLDSDDSWLLTVGEQMLGGQRLYIDIVETNPPASVLLYLPAILLARLLHLRPEPVVVAMVLALTALVFRGVWRLLLGGGLVRAEQRPMLLAAAMLAFVVLPGACFAQREHVAMLTMLPFMAIAALRAEGREISLSAALLAGIGAGVTMAIKPPFVLAVGPLILLAMIRHRSLRPAFTPEVVVAALVVIAYGLIVIAVFPAYLTNTLPMLRAVYLPTRAPAVELWLSAPMLMLAVLLAISLRLSGPALPKSLAVWPMIAAVGFAAAAILQAKGFLNHGLPYVALALLGFAILLIEGQGASDDRRLGTGIFVVMAGIACYFFAHIFVYTGLADALRKLAPPRPSIIVAGGDLAVGFPLTRQIDGRWAGRPNCLWMTADVMDMLARKAGHLDPVERAKLQAIADRDASQFVEDVMQQRPDIVLIEGLPGKQWISRHPTVIRALTSYRQVGISGEIFILRRTSRS